MDSETKKLWCVFRKYSTARYKNTPEKKADIQMWCDELYARAREEITLSYKLIISKNYSFSAFCINEQAYISDDAAVLTIPGYSNPKDQTDKADRRIGFYLSDMSNYENIWKALYQKNIVGLDSDDNIKLPANEYSDNIISHLTYSLKDQNLPGGLVNNFLDNRWELRIAKSMPEDMRPHRDDDLISKSNQRVWYRVINYAIEGVGPGFCTGEDENILISSPVGVTTSHYAEDKRYDDYYPLNKGPLHFAQGHPNGRSTLHGESRPTRIRKSSNSWGIQDISDRANKLLADCKL